MGKKHCISISDYLWVHTTIAAPPTLPSIAGIFQPTKNLGHQQGIGAVEKEWQGFLDWVHALQVRASAPALVDNFHGQSDKITKIT